MTIQEIKSQMKAQKKNQAQICKDLHYNKGDLSAQLNEKRPMPASRVAAFEYYFKYFEK